MKIIHFADLHIGVEAYGTVNSETGASTRIDDFLNSFDRLVELAIEEEVDLILFCGDVYKSRTPSQTQQREFAKRIKRLSDCNIPVHLVAGNHDVHNAAEKATTIDIFSTLHIPFVTVSTKPSVSVIETKSGKIQVVSVPWLRRSVLLAREDVRGLDFNGINDRMSQTINNIIETLSASLNPLLPTILAMHVWVQGCSTSSEGKMSIGNEHSLLLSSIARKEYDYVALGHIHRHQILNETPYVVYSGSLDSLDFGDEDDEKGFYLIEIDTNVAKREVKIAFKQTMGKRFLTLKAQISSDDASPMDRIITLLESAEDAIVGNIVRLVINTPQDCLSKIDDQVIHKTATQKYKVSYFDITRIVQKEERVRAEGVTAESLTSQEALEWYINRNDSEYSSETKAKLLEIGKAVISETDEKQLCLEI